MDANFTNVPWWATVLITLITSGGTFLATRSKSKDGVQKTLLTQAITRQQQLDERQEQMMDDLTQDINRLKDEQLLLRKELSAERLVNRELTISMETLKEENKQLKANNLLLVQQLNELKLALKKFEGISIQQNLDKNEGVN